MQFFARIEPSTVIEWGEARIPKSGGLRCSFCGLPFQLSREPWHIKSCSREARALARIINPSDVHDSTAPIDSQHYHDWKPPRIKSKP